MNILKAIRKVFMGGEESIETGRGKNKQPKFVIKDSKDNKFYFLLISPNGKVLVQSETYNSKQSAYVGIAAVQNYGTTENIVDETV